MTNVQTYQRPSSIEEAWSQLSEGGKSAKLVGGGVDVALFAPPEITTLIDLSSLDHRSIELDQGSLVLGAGITLTQMVESPEVAGYSDGIVGKVLRQVASPLLRNAATLGGTLASTHPWSDVIPLFLALDAQVTTYAGKEETTPLETLLEQRGVMDRAIITQVVLPALRTNTSVSFEKFVRTGFDVGMLNCACRLTIAQGVCSDPRVVFGGTPDIGQRNLEIEKMLGGASLTADVIEAAAELAAGAIPARDDVRASGDYRRILAQAGVRRCLHRIAKRVGERG